MEIIEAPEITPMPFGILSVADVTDSARNAARGYTYQTICGNSVTFVGSPCDSGRIATSEGVATLTLPEGFSHEVTIDWGDGTPAETYEPSGTVITHTYPPLPEPDPEFPDEPVESPVYEVTVTGIGGSYEVAGLDPFAASDIPLSAGIKADTGELTTVDSIHFAMYAQVRCSLVAPDPTVTAMPKLVAAEGHTIEGLLAAHAAPTEQAAMALRDAVAFALATWFASTDGARPILHINAALLGHLDSVGRHGSHLETKSGVLISAGTGYPTDRIILTSSVGIQRGTAIDRRVQAETRNEFIAFAEREYSFDTGCHPAISQEITPVWETP